MTNYFLRRYLDIVTPELQDKMTKVNAWYVIHRDGYKVLREVRDSKPALRLPRPAQRGTTHYPILLGEMVQLQQHRMVLPDVESIGTPPSRSKTGILEYCVVIIEQREHNAELSRQTKRPEVPLT